MSARASHERGDRDTRLPGWPATRSSAAPQPLTLERIVDAALRITDRDGVEALSMRRLGAELGVGATTLYWHVRNKDELLDLLIDQVIGEVRADVKPATGWRDELAESARSVRRVFMRHANLAGVLGSRPTFGPNLLDALEWLVGVLRTAGFSDLSAALGANAIVNWASAAAIFECRDPMGPSATKEEREVFLEAVESQFAALPPDRYPNTLSMLPIMDSITLEGQFESGLGWLLDGLTAELDRQRAGTAMPVTGP